MSQQEWNKLVDAVTRLVTEKFVLEHPELIDDPLELLRQDEEVVLGDD